MRIRNPIIAVQDAFGIISRWYCPQAFGGEMSDFGSGPSARPSDLQRYPPDRRR